MAEWHGIADADAHLGRAFPLPESVLPLGRWVDVSPVGSGAEVVWSLDDSRLDAPGRLALYAGPDPPPPRELPGPLEASEVMVGGLAAVLCTAPLDDAEPSLRPVAELCWRDGELHLRLTAQGPWSVQRLLEIAASIAA